MGWKTVRIIFSFKGDLEEKAWEMGTPEPDHSIWNRHSRTHGCFEVVLVSLFSAFVTAPIHLVVILLRKHSPPACCFQRGVLSLTCQSPDQPTCASHTSNTSAGVIRAPQPDCRCSKSSSPTQSVWCCWSLGTYSLGLHDVQGRAPSFAMHSQNYQEKRI